MVVLTDTFAFHAEGQTAVAGQTSDSDTDSDIANTEMLSLEYRDDPFKSFLRDLDYIAALDPQAALNLAELAQTENTFGTLTQTAALEEKIRELMELNGMEVRQAPEPALFAQAEEPEPKPASQPVMTPSFGRGFA